MKKKSKIILFIILAVLAAILLLIFFRSADWQMKSLSDRAMEYVRDYQFTRFLEKDPVREGLESAFEDKPESVEILYTMLKTNATGMEWQVIATDKNKAAATVDIQYQKLDSFVQAYAEELAEEVASRIAAGELTFQEADNILDILTDAENVVLLQKAEEKTIPEQTQTTAQIFFKKKAGLLYLPSGGSEELYNAASGNLYSAVFSVSDDVAEYVIRDIIDYTMDALANYDIDTLEQLTGADLSLLHKVQDSSALGAAVTDFLADCAGTITYEIIEYDPEQYSATISFDYPDASGIVKAYAGNLIEYGLTHLFSGTIMSDEISAEVFHETVGEQGELPRLQSSVTLSVNPETGEMDVPETIYNIVTANLYSQLGELAGLLS